MLNLIPDLSWERRKSARHPGNAGLDSPHREKLLLLPRGVSPYEKRAALKNLADPIILSPHARRNEGVHISDRLSTAEWRACQAANT